MEYSDVAMWSLIEPCVGIVAGSLPYIRPLCQRRRKIRAVAVPVTPECNAPVNISIKIEEDVKIDFEERSDTPHRGMGTQTMINEKCLVDSSSF